MRKFKYLFLFFIFILNINTADAWENISPTDKPVIQTILTQTTADRLKIDIKNLRLKPQFIKQSNNWIFISLDIQDVKGMPFKYPKGHHLYASAQVDMIGNTVDALLRKNDGNWELIDIAFNAMDVAWDGWDEKYHAPKHIFYTTCLRPRNEECKRLNQIPAPWQGTWHPPISYNGRSIGPPEPPFIIKDQTIVWERCGTEARKVKVFSKFYAKTSGILLEIEGEPCITEEGHPVSYIHLKKEEQEEYSTNPSCATNISFYERGAHAASNKNLALHGNIYTKTNCSAFTSKERRAMLDPIIKSASRKLNAKEIWQLRLYYERLEATGDWVFITASAFLERKDKFVIDIKASDITHFISALLKRNGSTWDVVEIDINTEKNKEKELYPNWHKAHHIPQDDKQKRILRHKEIYFTNPHSG